MTENRPRMDADDLTSPQNLSGVRKSSRLIKTSWNGSRPSSSFSSTSQTSQAAILHLQQDSSSVASTSTSNLNSNLNLSSSINEISNENSTTTTTTIKDSRTKVGKARKARWIRWDVGSENLFYDAVKLYGKDCDAITKYITQKSKSIAKSHEQVRNYYYNTSVKLCSRLNLSEVDVPKEIKELFALINYGEWRRKTNSAPLNVKRIPIFKNLVLNGWTTIKVANRLEKGKAVGKVFHKNRLRTRILRTPMCPALRKYIDGKDDVPVDTNLPKSVVIELVPNCQRDRAYVLGCWQNPLIRFDLNLNQPMSELLRWLQEKWIPQDLRMKKTLLGEDITNELADIVLQLSSDTTLRTINLNPVGPKSINVSAPICPSPGFVCCGLRYVRPSLALASSSERREQRAPSSPEKTDRKRRKSTPVINDAEPEPLPVECSSANKSKSARSDIASPVLYEGRFSGAAMARQFSDGGESSCDAYPMLATADIDDDRFSDPAGDQKLVFPTDFVQTIEEKQTPEKNESDLGKFGSDIPTPNHQHQQQVHGVVLNPDQYREGFSLSTCESLTVGQLCLMCDKAATIRFKYSITPKTSNNSVDANDAWHFFVNLVRSEFVDTLHKKPAAQSTTRHAASAPPEPATNAAMVNNLPAAEPGLQGTSASNDSSSPVSILHSVEGAIGQQPQRSDQGFLDSAFIKPKRKKRKGAVADGDEPKDPVPLQPVRPASVTNESHAFLVQMGQIMKKKAVVVNRRNAVVPPAMASTNFPLTRSMFHDKPQRQNDHQRQLILVPVGESISPVVANKDGAGHSAATAASSRAPAEVNVGASLLYRRPPLVRAESHTNTAVGALNTPDVSLMRSSPEPNSHSTAPHQEIAIEPQNAEQCNIVQAPVENRSGPHQELITSDSFLDFSMGSFPGFGQKSVGSPKRMAEKEPISSVIHSLRLECDDSALSSPPRPIRPGVNTIQRNATKGGYYQMTGASASNSNQFPSNSNLFPMLEASVDNESSNTRNFFAACALASTLETPEKCKDSDDRR